MKTPKMTVPTARLKRARSLLAILLLLSASHIVWTSAAVAQGAARLITGQATEMPVRLVWARVGVEIVGRTAVTTIELSMENPNARVLEGTLEFPLRDGQRVIALASEVNGALREAVVIEKAKGRQVFEEVVRNRIDPVLLEKTAGNNYRLRVYPINPRTTTRVRLQIMETLAQNKDGLHFRLPLGFATDLRKLELMIRVADPGAIPSVHARGLGSVSWKRAGRYYEAAIERDRIHKEALIELVLPERAARQLVTGRHADQTWFHTEVQIAPRRALRPFPRSIDLIWDASGSAVNRRLPEELALLHRYLKRVGEVSVVLHVLRDRLEAPVHYAVRRGNSVALLRDLRRLAYDGATNLSALRAAFSGDLALLFSDGLDNFGGGLVAPSARPVLVISSALQSDSARLAQIARRSAGTFVDLSDGKVAGALDQLLTQPASIKLLTATDLSDVVVAFSGNQLRIAGRVTGANPNLNAQLTGTRAATVAIDAARFRQAVDSAQAPRLWAAMKLDELSADRVRHRAEMLRIAKEHVLVTDDTSLIVLERIEDYVRHEINPPSELMAEYERARVNAQGRRDASLEQQSVRLAQSWEARKAWWEKDYPKDTPPPLPAPPPRFAPETGATPSVPPASGTGDRDRAGIREPRAAPAPAIPMVSAMAPPPAPSPMAPSAAAGAMAKSAGAGNGTPGGANAAAAAPARIQIQRWSANAPWVHRMAQASSADLYAVYLDERPGNQDNPSFFLETAELLARRGQGALAMRVLSNLAEMQIENRDLLRLLASRLTEIGQAKLAVPILRRVLAIAPDEPHSLRDLALALAASGSTQETVDLLNRLIGRAWDRRFGDIAEIALAERNALLASDALLTNNVIDSRLSGNLPVGLRIVLTWDTDNTDIDLWVTDPNGEKVFYSHRRSYQGGRISSDVTGSYGPEEFILRSPKPGRYQIHADFYGHRQQMLTSGTTVMAEITTDFGTPRQRAERSLLRLKERKETALVGEIEVP